MRLQYDLAKTKQSDRFKSEYYQGWCGVEVVIIKDTERNTEYLVVSAFNGLAVTKLE